MAVACLLLVSAGIEDPARAADEVSSSIRTETPAEAAESASAETQPEDVDCCLLLDGVPVSKDTCRTTVGDTTYVALGAMAKQFDPDANVTWNAETQTVTVTTETLSLTATVGELYLVANGRYLYMEDGVQLTDGRAMVSLDAVSKAFGAANGWDAEAGAFTVTGGSGAIVSGNDYYDENTLFWLSRVIYAESGNQPLKGKIGVGNVVLNRVASDRFPNTIQGVLSQKNQFTTYRGGKLAGRTPNAQSVVAAKLAMDGAVVREVAGALYFDGAPNSWAARHRPLLAVIGGHRFYG